MKIVIVLIMLLIAPATGCTTRSYYEGFRMQQEMECEKQPGADREECIRRSGMSYDEYQRQLKEHHQKE